MKCKNCKNYQRKEWCEKIADSPHAEIERDCEHFQAMTNADRIRMMTDEELAGFFGGMYNIPCKNMGFESEEMCSTHAYCSECLLDWLSQEAEE